MADGEAHCGERRRPGRAPVRAPRPAACSVLVASLVATLVAACAEAVPLAPVAPGLAALTPGSDMGGLAATLEPTAGPSPTAAVPPTRVVAPPEPLSSPPGFGAGVYADGLGPVRLLAVAPNGDLFASISQMDRVVVLPDRDADGVADGVHVFAEGESLRRPSGLAFHDGWLYVATRDSVLRYPYATGDLTATDGPEPLLALPAEGLHADRALLLEPDGTMYVSVGSSCNACVEQDLRRAAILRVEPDGSKVSRYASGVRNALGLEREPATGAIWFTDSERDLLAEDRPPDELNVLLPGGDYGWPACYGARVAEPEQGGAPARCAGTVPPAVELPAHAGAHGMAFYDGLAMPDAYRSGLFVALHGSWSRAIPVGYSLVHLPFAAGAPTGEVRPVVAGWLRPDTRRWGSPVDVAVAPDGALLVSDDGGGRVYRVFYDGPLGTPTPQFSR